MTAKPLETDGSEFASDHTAMIFTFFKCCFLQLRKQELDYLANKMFERLTKIL